MICSQHDSLRDCVLPAFWSPNNLIEHRHLKEGQNAPSVADIPLAVLLNKQAGVTVSLE